MAAKLTVNQGLCWCVLTFFIACANCLNSLPCIEVKRAYTEKGGNENEVPIQAISGDHLEVCPRGDGYTCCTRDMEIKLRELSAKEYDSLVDQSFRYVQSTFVSRTRKFDEFFTELLHNAKKDLHEMFVKTYGLLYRENAEIFTQLFEDLLKYYKGTDKSLTSTLDKFFENLLRRMFQLLNVQHKFDDVYLKCVTSKMDQLKPFGAVPQKLSSQVRRSFIAARTFVQGLAIGRDVILEVAKLRPTPACTKALMRMSYCPQCRGLTQTKPCNNYCLNTMKGCLAYHAELNILWNDYIEAMKQLAIRLEGPFNIESVVDPIDVKISDAIMILQENSITVRDQIFEGCGKPRTQSSGVRGKRSADNSTVGHPTPDHQGQPPITPVRQADDPQENPFGGKLNFGAGEVVPETGDAAEKKNPYDQHFVGQYKPPGGKNVKPTTAAGTSLDRLVRDIKDKVKAAKDFWIQLPYSVCNDDKIAAQPDNDDECWNGQDRARYEAEVQKDGVINQINNPEVTVDVNEANYIIEQQKIQLKIITDKLQTAYKGGDVTYIYTAKDIPGSSYKPLADALVKQSNQTLMVVVLDDQPNIFQMPIAFVKALNMVIVNGHKGKVFLAAHGDGGQVVAAFGSLSSRYIEGIVLFSSYLIRGTRLNTYKRPILTLNGDLDGITRITRIVDTFEELQGDVAQNPNQKFITPVIVMEGINYGQFASKANITYDLNPEVSQADAFGIIFNYTYAFMVATQNDSNKNIAAAKAVLEKGYINTETLLQPLSEVKALDENIKQVSHWTITAQQLIINSLTPISVEFVNHEITEASERQQHKHNFRVLDDLKINSTTKLVFANNRADEGILPQSPTQLTATMTSQDAVKKLTTSSQFGNPSTCQDINQEAVNFAYSKSSSTAQRRYQTAMAPITFMNDVNASTFDQWNQASLQLIYNNTGLFVGATRFRTNKPNSDQSIGEQDDCTLLSPYRAMEWIYIDALRYNKQWITK